MSRFKPGDPVWARSTGIYHPAGEYPAILLRIDFVHEGTINIWAMDVLTMPGPEFQCGEENLRPRRDDYQQHEPLGHRTNLNTPLNDDPITGVPQHANARMAQSR